MTPSTTPALTLANDSLSVRQIGPWLHEVLDGVPPEESGDLASRLELAVHEVAMNVVDHASLPPDAMIRVTAEITESLVEITVTDPGEAFDPDGTSPPVAVVPQERGYGLMIIQKLVDQLSYSRLEAGNQWTLRINRIGPADRGEAERINPHG